MQLAEAISNIPVPSQLSGKIHVMLYLQTLSVDDSLDAQLDSNDQEKKERFYCCLLPETLYNKLDSITRFMAKYSSQSTSSSFPPVI